MSGFAKTCFIIMMAVLALGIMAGLIRAIRGPRRADRILGINVIGSLSTAMLAVLAVYLKESWLLDVSLVYGMMSFLSVVVLARIHIASRNEVREDRTDQSSAKGPRRQGQKKNRKENGKEAAGTVEKASGKESGQEEEEELI